MSLNNLLENLIKNNQSVGFDFTKSDKSNQFPYSSDTRIHQMDTGEEVPLVAQETKWENISDRDTNYLKRTFKLTSSNHILYFVSELIKKSDKVQHHPTITIDHLEIKIILYTKELNDVSDLDIDMAKYIDELYQDVRFIRSL
jgi:4a-hydroxytetrahydrobiopterin dehydratase